MELLGQQVFEHQHTESAASNPDRSFSEWQMLGNYVDQNLDMILVEMKFEEFAPVAVKGSVQQCYNPN